MKIENIIRFSLLKVDGTLKTKLLCEKKKNGQSTYDYTISQWDVAT